LPPELSRIVLRAMARDVSERYPTMESLVSALEPFTLPNAMRSTGQRSLQNATPQDLEATRIESISETGLSASLPPHGPTRPHLASTPFAAEMRELDGARRSVFGGTAAFAVAAAAIVMGVWYFMQQQPAAGVPTSATQLQGASDYRVEPLPTPPSGVDATRTGAVPPASTAPAPADVTTVQRPVHDADAPLAPSNPVEGVRSGTRGPTESPRGSANASQFEPIPDRSSRSATGRRGANHGSRGQDGPVGPSGSPRSPRSPHRSDTGREQAANQPESEIPSGTDSPVMRVEPAPKPTHRARSGSLNVNEF